MTQAALAAGIGAPPKMLIADDDPAIVRLLAEWCLKAGFEVDTAADGLQALIKANRSHPDILLIDLNMPGPSGLSVCARLLEQDKHPLNVVLITGNQEQETVERCDGFGVFYVRKGIEFWSDLILALSEIFPSMAHTFKQMSLSPRREIVSSRPRVLIIDDDPDVPTFLRSRLSKLSIDALFAISAPLGFRTACREQPNVIITEYSMPDGDIYYLLAKLRTTRTTENIPVFAWTAQRLTEIDRQNLKREVCGHPGVAQILEKSPDASEIFTSLQPIVAFDEPKWSSERFAKERA